MRVRTLLTAGTLMTTMTLQGARAADAANTASTLDPTATGASVAWTSTDEKVVEGRKLYAAGRYADAVAAVHGDGGDREARAELVEMVRRARQEYTLDDAMLLEKIRKSIPDVTAADVNRWADARQLTYKTIDGKRLFFNREPSNLWKWAPDARERAGKPKSLAEDATTKWKLVDHLKFVIDEADRTGQEFVAPVHHRIKYTLSIVPADGGAKEGSTLKVWLPYVQEYRQQRNVKLIGTTPEGGFVAPSAVDGTPMTGAPQRTVYFEKKVADPKREEKFVVEFEYDSFAYYPKLDDEKARPLAEGFDSTYLAERPPHIAFTPEIRKATADAVGDETNPLRKARKIFHYISDHLKYAYEDEYCTIPAFAQKAITTGRGDCGIHATLFITMCRCAGVPARWQSGWESKVTGDSMHDWAEFYVAPWGWLPADQSYGLQDSDDPRVREFYIGHQDSYRQIFNLDYGQQLQPPKKSLRSEPADFQRGEVEIDGKNVYFDGWDYKIDIQRSEPGKVAVAAK